MDAPATYTLAPPCTAACAGCAKPRGPEAPALLSAFQLAGLADALTAEREDCASEPANALGYWPAAVAGLLAHVAAARPGLTGPEAPAPPLLSAERLAGIAAFVVKCRAFQQLAPGFDDEHMPAGQGGNGMVNDMADLLGHIAALSAADALFPAGPWTEGMESSRRQLQLDCFTLKQRALKAEARVQEQQAELSEQERDKLALLIELGSRTA